MYVIIRHAEHITRERYSKKFCHGILNSQFPIPRMPPNEYNFFKRHLILWKTRPAKMFKTNNNKCLSRQERNNDMECTYRSYFRYISERDNCGTFVALCVTYKHTQIREHIENILVEGTWVGNSNPKIWDMTRHNYKDIHSIHIHTDIQNNLPIEPWTLIINVAATKGLFVPVVINGTVILVLWL